MPPQQGVGLDEVERLSPGAANPSEQKQDQAVALVELAGSRFGSPR